MVPELRTEAFDASIMPRLRRVHPLSCQTIDNSVTGWLCAVGMYEYCPIAARTVQMVLSVVAEAHIARYG